MKKLVVLFILSIGALFAGLRYGMPVKAQEVEKVMICHATNSHTNPYTVNNIDTSSVDELNNHYLNGHGDHLGQQVWYEGIADHSWGDIIPAFVSLAGTSFPGYNWPEGQVIWEDECKIVIIEEEPTPTATSSATLNSNQHANPYSKRPRSNFHPFSYSHTSSWE